MNRAFSISSLFLILFLAIFHCVQSTNDIIGDTCQKLVANNTELNFDFCVKSLGSDSESHKANLEGLGLIGLKLFQANFTGTAEYIKQLVKQKLEPRLLKALSLCLDLYASVEDKDLTPFYKAKRYADVNTWVSAMKANADVCDKQYTRKGGMVPPLTKRNADVEHLSAIVLGILTILTGRA
ncbi:hypothetical protein NL676_009573 [Syzygium grande]|nr:hypothetical protein NL676_009573 [Syzygium grande]